MAYKWENGKIKKVELPKKLPKELEEKLEKYWEETEVDFSYLDYIKEMDIEIVKGKSHCFQKRK